METKKVWVRSEIENLLASNDRAVGRAMVALLDRQTQDEVAAKATRHDNKRGFSAPNARRGTYFAEWVKAGRELTGHHLDKARRIALFHAGQLTDIANKVR